MRLAGTAHGFPGRFITFEGPEGAGKTTQIRLLAEELRSRGFGVACTREPGGDAVGEKVRAVIMQSGVTTEAELLLAAARAQNVQGIVRPALAAGHIVLCDRYTDSTLAYQGGGRGIPFEILRIVNEFATSGLIPDLTLLLDLPPAAGLARQTAEKQNRLDRESLAFHERVRAAFLEIVQHEPDRMVLIDAGRPLTLVTAEVNKVVLTLLGQSPTAT